MKVKLSEFGRKFAGPTGITELMRDLGEAFGGERELLMLGGGNPAHVPTMQEVWRREMRALLDDQRRFDLTMANYDDPQGQPEFIEALVECLNQRYGWGLKPANVAITNGSQNAFFFLFNMLAGEFGGGARKRILLPLTPEYIGYADQGLTPGLFETHRPAIEHLDDRTFKYRVDFKNLRVTKDVAAICVSRPTNPTGNVLTNDEISHLSQLARSHDIPLIVDNAYGAPFPDIIFTEAQPTWDEHMILVLSLSKLGLPGTRTGIIIAPEEIAAAITSINAVVSLANGNIGQTLVSPLLRSGELLELSRTVIRPFYEKKSRQALDWVRASFPADRAYHVHKSEGALFLWLWFPELPITAQQLYERLKTRGVIVVPGHYFFYGLKDEWRHPDECIRLSYSQHDDVVEKGIRIIGEEVDRAYQGK